MARFQEWPMQFADFKSPKDIQRAYETGWVGAKDDPVGRERLRHNFTAQTGFATVGDAAHQHNWADSGKGKLSVAALMAVKEFWPKAFPGDAQQVGSCVSHGGKNAGLACIAAELKINKPDPITGKLEGKPDVPPEGEASGVFASAPIYWERGYDGDGWMCAEAAEVMVNKTGLVVAKNYEEFGVDLTNVTRSVEHMYGRRSYPEEWRSVFGAHRFHSCAEATSFEELRDAIANGYCANTCGSESYSDERDENGVSVRTRAGWAHSMACLAVDDRPETHQLYGEPLIWIQNSWANWNSGSLKIHGTQLEGVPGGFWTKWSLAKNRYFVVFSNANGWPSRELPDYGFDYLN